MRYGGGVKGDPRRDAVEGELGRDAVEGELDRVQWSESSGAARWSASRGRLPAPQRHLEGPLGPGKITDTQYPHPDYSNLNPNYPNPR
jgi:hypothetical protein